MRFRGRITNLFVIQDKGLVVMMTEIEGFPVVGQKVRLLGVQTSVKALGENSTDGQPVSTRSCLTGQQVPPYGGVMVEWEGPVPRLTAGDSEWLEEEIES